MEGESKNAHKSKSGSVVKEMGRSRARVKARMRTGVKVRLLVKASAEGIAE